MTGETVAEATSRPGLQYGATVARADQHLISTDTDTYDYTLYMTTRARAQAGQGQTIALAKGEGENRQGGMINDVRSDSNAARWYMSPGHAVSGIANIGRGGGVVAYSENRARSSLGTAQGGILTHNIGTGDFNGGQYSANRGGNAFLNGDYVAVGSFIDNKVYNDAGNAAAGYVQIAKSFEEDASVANDPGAAASTAVGNAVAGGISVVLAEDGAAFIGDYDDEFDTYENDVAGEHQTDGVCSSDNATGLSNVQVPFALGTTVVFTKDVCSHSNTSHPERDNLAYA